MTLEILFVLVAAFGAGFIDAMAGGGGLIQLPALFAAFPQAPHTTLLGTGKLAGFAGTTSAIVALHPARQARLEPGAAGRRRRILRRAGRARGSRRCSRRSGSGRWCRCCCASCSSTRCCTGPRAATHEPRDHGRHGRWLAAGSAGLIGLYDGFFGPGTGSFLVFLFVRVFGLDFLHASASAKIVNAATNVAAHHPVRPDRRDCSGCSDWRCRPATSSGAQFGSHLAIRRGSVLVRKVFLGVVGTLIAKTAWDALRLHL